MNNLTFALESMTSTWPELEALVQNQEQEMGLLGVATPDVEKYFKLESEGIAKLFVARSGRKAVGYSLMLLVSHPHYKEKTVAFADALFVTPEHRGIGAVRFIGWVDEFVKFLGADMITRSVSVRNDYSRTLVYLGYGHSETTFMKEVK